MGLVNIEISIDENYIKFERKAYNIVDALSSTGGFMGILFTIVNSLIGGI